MNAAAATDINRVARAALAVLTRDELALEAVIMDAADDARGDGMHGLRVLIGLLARDAVSNAITTAGSEEAAADQMRQLLAQTYMQTDPDVS